MESYLSGHALHELPFDQILSEFCEERPFEVEKVQDGLGDLSGNKPYGMV